MTVTTLLRAHAYARAGGSLQRGGVAAAHCVHARARIRAHTRTHAHTRAHACMHTRMHACARARGWGDFGQGGEGHRPPYPVASL